MQFIQNQWGFKDDNLSKLPLQFHKTNHVERGLFTPSAFSVQWYIFPTKAFVTTQFKKIFTSANDIWATGYILSTQTLIQLYVVQLS